MKSHRQRRQIRVDAEFHDVLKKMSEDMRIDVPDVTSLLAKDLQERKGDFILKKVNRRSGKGNGFAVYEFSERFDKEE